MVADLPKCCENFSRHTKHSLWNEILLDHDQFLFHITHLSTIISINFDSHKKFSFAYDYSILTLQFEQKIRSLSWDQEKKFTA